MNGNKRRVFFATLVVCGVLSSSAMLPHSPSDLLLASDIGCNQEPQDVVTYGPTEFCCGPSGKPDCSTSEGKPGLWPGSWDNWNDFLACILASGCSEGWLWEDKDGNTHYMCITKDGEAKE